MYQAPFSDWVRNEVGIATLTVGAVTTPDQVTRCSPPARRIRRLARPHLTNPYFTLQASPGTRHEPVLAAAVLAGRDQAFRLAARERAEQADLRCAPDPTATRSRKGVINSLGAEGKGERRYGLFSWRARMALKHKGLEFATRPVCLTDKAAIEFSGGRTVP